MDESALIAAMTARGHTDDTARAAIAGRGYDDLAREYLGSSGSTSSTGGLDMSQVPSVKDYVQKQIDVEDPYFQTLLTRMEGQEKPLDIYSRLEEEAGVPTLRKSATSLAQEIYDLEDTIKAVEPNVSARTRESFVTEAQRKDMVTAQKKPLREKLETFSTNLGRIKEMLANAMANISTKTGLALKGQEMELEPLKLQYTTMVDRNARLLTGFTSDRQDLLDSLYDKLERQRYLDDRDWDLANTIASEEREYKMALQQAAASAGYKVTGSESIDELLGIVGDKAAEQIAFERAKANKGTASEREQATAREQLKKDVANNARHDWLMVQYGDTLPQYEITAAYNAGPMAGQFGAADVGMDIRNVWNLTQKESSNESSGFTVNADGSITFQ